MNVLSLFDGISCGQLALVGCGIKYDKYFASEIDKNAIKVTQRRFPETVQLGDVCKVTGSSLPKIDLLIGGSPCQSFSFAGKRAGFDGKSGLFYEYARLYKELKSINPDLKFFLENVRMKKEWSDVISNILGVQPIAINSRVISAQNRPRLYWTNIPVSDIPTEDSPLVMRDIVEKEPDQKFYCSPEKIAKIPFYAYRQATQVFELDRKSPALTCGGNNKWHINDRGIRKLTPIEYERLQTIPDNHTDNLSCNGRKNVVGNAWTVEVVKLIFKGLKNVPAEVEKELSRV